MLGTLNLDRGPEARPEGLQRSIADESRENSSGSMIAQLQMLCGAGLVHHWA